MIVLDTNVVSEPTKPEADPAVSAWLDRQPIDTLYITAVSLGELLLGTALLPEGRRKRALTEAGRILREQLFGPRILPFDEAAATMYAAVVSKAKASGQAISVADGQVAAIAKQHGFAVATRDTAPFAAAGVQVTNPWTA